MVDIVMFVRGYLRKADSAVRGYSVLAEILSFSQTKNDNREMKAWRAAGSSYRTVVKSAASITNSLGTTTIIYYYFLNY